MTGVVKAVAHGASPRQNHAGYLPTRAINSMAGTSTPYTAAYSRGGRAADAYHQSRQRAGSAATPGGKAGPNRPSMINSKPQRLNQPMRRPAPRALRAPREDTE